jgi:hypothetical protein
VGVNAPERVITLTHALRNFLVTYLFLMSGFDLQGNHHHGKEKVFLSHLATSKKPANPIKQHLHSVRSCKTSLCVLNAERRVKLLCGESSIRGAPKSLAGLEVSLDSRFETMDLIVVQKHAARSKQALTLALKKM